MIGFTRKLGIVVLLCAAFASAAFAQVKTCNLQLNPITFIEGTTDTNPLEGVSLKLKTGKKVVKEISASPYTFVGVSSGAYDLLASKDGFRTTTQTVVVDCPTDPSEASTTVGRIVIMWQGDPAKSVDYTSEIRLYGRNQSTGTGPAYEMSPGVPSDTAKSYTLGAAEKHIASDQTVINGNALVLAKPKYPPTAKAVGARGVVEVVVTIDEDGYVIQTESISGHPLLKAVSALAAKASRFKPTLLSGKPVKVTGIIVYNFG
jgi:hypothetical protein